MTNLKTFERQRGFGQRRATLIAILCVAGFSGCATELPKFSHIHVGHALTGWVDTPGNRGLFVTAEQLAEDIAELSVEADEAAERGSEESAKSNLNEMADIIGEDRRVEIRGPGSYTFLVAFQASMDHLEYAIDSDDASPNMKTGLAQVLQSGDTIFARTEVLNWLVKEGAAERDDTKLASIARESRVLAVQNLEGEDINKNGVIGDLPDEYGLLQLRRDLAAVIEREDPPYRAVEQVYLFGLIRLPDGTWSFRDPNAGVFSGQFSGGNGGGGY